MQNYINGLKRQHLLLVQKKNLLNNIYAVELQKASFDRSIDIQQLTSTYKKEIAECIADIDAVEYELERLSKLSK